MHVFEREGLGKAPFQCVGYRYDGNYASKCQYCGQTLMHVFLVGSADKRRFEVGCDCILKTGDAGLEYGFKNHPDYVKAMKDKKIAKAIAVRIELTDLIAHYSKSLNATPHHISYLAAQGKTMLDYCNWMMQYAGDSGRNRLLRQLRQYKGK